MSRTFLLPFLIVLFIGVASPALATNSPTIELEKTVHFLTPGGEDVVVEQGRYEVAQASEWLHLTPVGGEKTDAILVEATPIAHEETIEVPTILSRSEQEDEYVIILLLPDGTGLEALGSYSGVRSKAVRRPTVRRPRAAPSSNQGIRPTKPARLKAAVASDPSLKRAPRAISPGSNKKRQIRRRTQPDGRIGTTLNQGADSKPNLPGVGPIPGPPKITGAGLQPDKKIGSIQGKLAPGGTIVIFGKNFGWRKGKVRLRVDPSHFPEYPSGVPLQLTAWSDTKVKAKIPSSMTGPIFSVNVAIRLTRVNPVKTDEYIKAFQVPVDKRILRRTDYEEVQLINCVNMYDSRDDCQERFDRTISGSHKRDWDAIEMGEHHDKFAIHLKNGWVFSRLLNWSTYITGDDGDYVKKPTGFPVGKTTWNPSVRWLCTADDAVYYGLNVEVIRAKGAY